MQRYLKGIVPFVLLLIPFAAFAAEPAGAAPATGSINFLLVGLLGVVVTLMFVIGMAGNVLRKLSIVLKDKEIDKKYGDGGSVVRSVLLLAAIFSGIPAFAQEAAGETAHANWNAGSVGGIPIFDFYVIMGVIVLELVVLFCMLVFIKIFIGILNAKPELAPAVKAITKTSFWDRFNKVVPIEKEKDILLDHNYDGIQELDNALPPWWIYGFYLTIIVAVIYLWRFHVSETGYSQTQEYVAEMEQAEKEKAAYLATSANNVDETTVKLATDEATLASGKKMFEASCAACHANDGGGGVGPNLTDEFWIHGGSIQDVFKSIKYGWQDKGMKSWKDDFSAKQIAELSSYVKHLTGTKPLAPKDAQGEKYTEDVPDGKTADSTAGKTALN
jgi:cytochrome c oxidase cbb3-type subunit 3